MNNDNSLDPLCFILVKSGAHGGKLLFKYPFNNHTEVHNESVHCNCSGGNPYRLTLSEDLLNQVRGFLAPSGAQGVAISARLSVCLSRS